jgi:2-polyprenyl-3-methyl-5-hydroxy-6-metoxy-1,4-benzoquinol methylase
VNSVQEQPQPRGTESSSGQAIESRDERSIVSRIVANQENLIVRLYARIRFVILRQQFLQEIGQYLPREGRILDLGCGFGLFSLYFALDGPGRRLTGVDLSARRIEWARQCAERLGVTNVSYTASNVLAWEENAQFDAVFMLDLIHHLPRNEVEGFLRQVTSLIAPGGILILKDVSNRPFYKRWFTLALDRLMVGMEPIHYWDPSELSSLIEGLGFRVKRHTMNDFLPYPHILYLCTLDGRQSTEQ